MRTMQEQLIEKRLSERREDILEQENIKARKKINEELSDKDWAEIMNSNSPTYKRGKGGAIRRNR